MNGSKTEVGKFRDLSVQSRRRHFVQRTFGQSISMGLEYLELSMSSSFTRKALICLCWSVFFALPAAIFAQTNYYGANGGEYAIAGQLPGDQMHPDVALGSKGGFVVWQDNATDGNGLGISA